MNQRGFIALPMMAWAAIGAAVVIAGLGVALKVQTSRLDAVRAEYAAFRAQVEALGEAAKREAARIEAADKDRKGKADAENAKTKRDLAGLYTAYGKLRDSRSGSGILPAAAPGAASPATAAFDRAALDRALSGFDRGVTGLLAEGDAAIADLDTARRWAQ